MSYVEVPLGIKSGFYFTIVASPNGRWRPLICVPSIPLRQSGSPFNPPSKQRRKLPSEIIAAFLSLLSLLCRAARGQKSNQRAFWENNNFFIFVLLWGKINNVAFWHNTANHRGTKKTHQLSASFVSTQKEQGDRGCMKYYNQYKKTVCAD